MSGRLTANIRLASLTILLQLFASASFGQQPTNIDGKRAVEINVMLAWLADAELCRFYPRARHDGSCIQVGGCVPNDRLRQRALDIAHSTSGLPVSNRLNVVPAVNISPIKVSNATLLKNAALALQTEFPHDCAACEFFLYGDGQLAIGGMTVSHERKLIVSERLRRIPGCVCVSNELKVVAPAALRAALKNGAGTRIANSKSNRVSQKMLPNVGPLTGRSRSSSSPYHPTVAIAKKSMFRSTIQPKPASLQLANIAEKTKPDNSNSEGPVLPIPVDNSSTSDSAHGPAVQLNRPVVEPPHKPILSVVNRLPNLQPVPKTMEQVTAFRNINADQPPAGSPKKIVSNQITIMPTANNPVQQHRSNEWHAAPVIPKAKYNPSRQYHSTPRKYFAKSFPTVVSPYHPIAENTHRQQTRKNVILARRERGFAGGVQPVAHQVENAQEKIQWSSDAANYTMSSSNRHLSRKPGNSHQMRTSLTNSRLSENHLARLIWQTCGRKIRNLKLQIKSNGELLVRFTATSEAQSDAVARQIMDIPSLSPFSLKLVAKIQR